MKPLDNNLRPVTGYPFSQLNTTRSGFASRRNRLQSSDATRVAVTEIFPNWLKERKDFQDTLRNYDNIDALNICEICSKSSSLRSAVEIKALELWQRKCYFFKGMGKNTKAAICERLKTRHFFKNDFVMNTGIVPESLYIIVTGKALLEKNGIEIELGPYNAIGEKELMRSAEVTDKISASTDLDCVYLSKYDFDILAFKSRLKEQYNFKEKLKKMKCFSSWRISKIEQLCGSMTIVQYSAKDVVYDTKQPSSFFYYIKKGSVVVDLLITLNKKNNWPVGKQMWETLLTQEKYSRTVKEFVSGDIFGERELLLNLNRETKAVASSDRTVLYLFCREEFNEIFNKKEKEEFLEFNDKSLASPEVAKKLKNQIAQYKLRFNSLLQASDIKRVRKGRGLWDESISMKKDSYGKELIKRHNQNMRLILKEKKFSISVSPRTTVSTF
jgi:CRP-like cAMP-binding protein